jgi:hypothetical protein
VRRTLTMLGLVVSIFALTAGSVLAAKPSSSGTGSPHVVGDLSYTFDGNLATISGTVAGLGSGWGDATASGSVSLTFDITCTNQGGTAAPGQQGGSTTVSGTGTVDGPNANGTYTFTLTASVDTSNARRLGCPNSKTWTASADITGATLLSLTFTNPDGTSVNVKL